MSPKNVFCYIISLRTELHNDTRIVYQSLGTQLFTLSSLILILVSILLLIFINYYFIIIVKMQ